MASTVFFDKPCFGKYKCWRGVRAKCPLAEECRLRRIAEDKKKNCAEVSA